MKQNQVHPRTKASGRNTPDFSKRPLTHSLKLLRERGDDQEVAETLGYLSDADRQLGLCEEGIKEAREASEISNDWVKQLDKQGG